MYNYSTFLRVTVKVSVFVDYIALFVVVCGCSYLFLGLLNTEGLRVSVFVDELPCINLFCGVDLPHVPLGNVWMASRVGVQIKQRKNMSVRIDVSFTTACGCELILTALLASPLSLAKSRKSTSNRAKAANTAHNHIVVEFIFDLLVSLLR